MGGRMALITLLYNDLAKQEGIKDVRGVPFVIRNIITRKRHRTG